MAAQHADVHRLKGEEKVTDWPQEARNCGNNLRLSFNNAVWWALYLRPHFTRIAASRHVLRLCPNLNVLISVILFLCMTLCEHENVCGSLNTLAKRFSSEALIFTFVPEKFSSMWLQQLWSASGYLSLIILLRKSLLCTKIIRKQLPAIGPFCVGSLRVPPTVQKHRCSVNWCLSNCP